MQVLGGTRLFEIASGISSFLFCWEVGQKGMQMTINWAWPMEVHSGQLRNP